MASKMVAAKEIPTISMFFLPQISHVLINCVVLLLMNYKYLYNQRTGINFTETSGQRCPDKGCAPRKDNKSIKKPIIN